MATAFGKSSNFAAVLLGGVLSSIYALLQFVFAPFWGAASDRHGRRKILSYTVAGTALSYVLWIVSGSFWLFVAALYVQIVRENIRNEGEDYREPDQVDVEGQEDDP